jgi:hypothetical protein
MPFYVKQRTNDSKHRILYATLHETETYQEASELLNKCRENSDSYFYISTKPSSSWLTAKQPDS